MIDFRYHLVSIVAIFLALALGLIIGASALQGPTTSVLRETDNSLNQSNQALRNQQRSLESAVGYNDQAMSALAPQVVGDRLKNESVVFVTMPGASDQVRNGVYNMIVQAGARLTGTVTMQGKYLEAGQAAGLDALTSSAKATPTPTPTPSPSADAAAYARASARLAGLLVTANRALAGQEEPDAGTVLDAFRAAGYLNYTGKPTGRATLAVVVAPSNPSQAKNADDQNSAMVSLTAALGADSVATAMVGPTTAAAGGGLISKLRSGDVDGQVATVDTADNVDPNNPPDTVGQVVTVLALDRLIHQKKGGDYGMTGHDGVVPSPLPPPPNQNSPASPAPGQKQK